MRAGAVVCGRGVDVRSAVGDQTYKAGSYHAERELATVECFRSQSLAAAAVFITVTRVDRLQRLLRPCFNPPSPASSST